MLPEQTTVQHARTARRSDRVRLYYGGNVQVYAPNPYQGGSSLSHLDPAYVSGAVMRPSLASATAVRTPSALEWEITKDLGWSISTGKGWTKGAGTLNWSDGANWNPGGTPNQSHDATFTNTGLTGGDTIDLGGDQSANTLKIDSTTDFTIGGPSGTLILRGGNIVRTSASSGTQTIARPIALGNYAVWDIAGSGQLTLAGAISGSNSLQKQGSGTLVLGAGPADATANTYSGSTVVSAGSLVLNKQDGTNAVPGDLRLRGGSTVRLSQSNQIADTAAVDNYNGTLDLGGNQETVGSLMFNSLVQGPGTLRVIGPTTSSGNRNVGLYAATLENAGTATFSDTNTLHAKNGATVRNLVGGLIDLQGTNNFVNDDGTTPALYNEGTLRKTTSGSSISIGFALNNTGTVQVECGTLSLTAGGTSTGTFEVASGAILSFSGGTHEIGGSTFLNSGTVSFSAPTTSLQSAVNVPGSVNIAWTSTLNVNAPTVSAFTGAVTLDGYLDGGGDVQFAQLEWRYLGTMQGTGKTIIGPGGALRITGNGNKYFHGRPIENFGTATWTGAGRIHCNAGSVFNNRSGATFDAQNDSSFYRSSGGYGTFNNDGTFRKSAGLGTTELPGERFNNTGTVQVQCGTLSLGGGGSSTGTFEVASGATLSFNGGIYGIGGSTFLNSGTIEVRAAAIYCGSPVSVPGSVIFAGDLLGDGDVQFAQLEWRYLGTMQGAGKTIIAPGGALSITGDGDKYQSGRPIDNFGTATWTGAGRIRFNAGSVFNNKSGAIFDAQNDSSFYWYSGAYGTFNNEGTFRKSAGTGTTSLGATLFDNSGTVEVQSGTLMLSGGVAQLPGSTLTGGTWIAGPDATLEITTGGNILTNQGDVTLDGAGSTFAKINALADNQGSFSILGGRVFDTVGDLMNSGTITVGGSGSALEVNGALTTLTAGTGQVFVDAGGTLTASYIRQASVELRGTAGAPAKVIIRPSGASGLMFGGGGGAASTAAVPEPGQLLLLVAAAVCLGVYTLRRRLAGSPVGTFGWYRFR